MFFAHPTVYTLKTGDCLFIPAKWWHWVSTPAKSFAINYWFESTSTTPRTFKSSKTYDIHALDNQHVSIWDTTTNTHKQFKFKNFYNCKQNNLYLITLDNYSFGLRNTHLKKMFHKQVQFENWNMWVSSGKHDTGLHYDDNAGILEIVEGEKQVILYPPSDSVYLYPFPVKDVKWWEVTRGCECKYNSYQLLQYTNSKSSNGLLATTTPQSIQNAIQQYYIKHQRLIWGYKKEGKKERWEVYKYTLDAPIENPCIESWDIGGQGVHRYYRLLDNSFPFWGHGTYNHITEVQESKIFVVDSYMNFYHHYTQHMATLGYSSIADKWKDIILHTYYGLYEISIHNKTPGNIYVQYMGVQNDDFIRFLQEFDYPQATIDYVDSFGYRLNNEIAIVYDIETLQPVRTAIYGILL